MPDPADVLTCRLVSQDASNERRLPLVNRERPDHTYRRNGVGDLQLTLEDGWGTVRLKDKVETGNSVI